MALLDTASLIVTPNGYKASKLYSIVPTDGTGDMTFSRTGNTATRVNSSGLIETVNANIPRLDYLGSTCPKLLMEPQRTNLFLRSQEFDNAYWLKTRGTVTANATTSPDGTTNAETIVSTSGQSNGPAIYLRSLTFTGATIYTVSIFAKKLGDTNNVNIDYSDNSTGYTGGSILFNLSNQTFAITQSPNSSVSGKMEDYGNGWYRCSMTFTTIATPTFFNIGFTISSTSTGNTCGFYGAQLEAGSFATSYIPTTTASVTRNVDSCTKSSATALIGQTEGAMVIDVDINSRISSTQFMLRNTAVTSYISFIITSSVIQCAIYNASTQTVTINYTNSSTGRFKLGIAYKLNDVAYYVNGSLIGTDTSTDIPAMTEIDLYFNANNFLKVNSFTHWKTRLTNSELATLTTL